MCFLLDQGRCPERTQHAGEHAAEGDLMRQNEVIDVDERARDQQGEEDPQRYGHRPPLGHEGPGVAVERGGVQEGGVEQRGG